MSGFQNPIVAGDQLVRSRIRSANYQGGLAGWAINEDGSAEFNELTVVGNMQGPISSDKIAATNSLTYQGTELSDILAAMPQGVIAIGSSGTFGGTTWGTGIQGPIALCSINADPTRYYIFSVDGLRHYMAAGTAGRTLLIQLRFTTDGSVPTATSPILAGADGYYSYGKVGGWSDSQSVKGHAWHTSGLLTVGLFIGIGESDVTSTNAITASANPYMFYCEDMGTYNPNGVTFNTPTVATPSSTKYDTTWTFTNVQSYQENGNKSIATGNNSLAYQGNGDSVGNPGGNHSGFFFFNSAAIRSALAGSTILNSYIYLDSQWSYLNSGVQGVIGTHNSDPVPATVGAFTQNRWDWNFNPRGADAWTSDLGVTFGQQLRDGAVRGIVMGGAAANSINFYSKFQNCKIRVVYQK